VPGTNLSQIQKSKGSPSERPMEYLLRVHRTVSGAQQLGWQTSRSRESMGVLWLKFIGLSSVHQIVRWTYNARTNGRQRNQRATRGLSQRSVGAPDCPVRQEDRGRNGRLRQKRKEIGHQTRYCSCPMVHRTVRCDTRQKTRIAFQMKLQQLLGPLGL
jgi:hypothetical protein